MKPILRDYIYFTRSQRKALIFISILIVSLILFNHFAHHIFQDEIDVEIDYLELKHQQLREKQSGAATHQSELEDSDHSEARLFPFDPNQITLSDWQKLGLSEAQAKSIIKYRDKGGSFRIKADLKKMYVVSQERFAKWEPYIQLPDRLVEADNVTSSSNHPVRSRESLILDLNLADSAALTKLKGIGPVYASRIARFRKALGGFYSLDQLSEVWGLDDSTLLKLRPHLRLTDVSLSKLKINQLEAADLKSHPYLNWQQANAIVNYRKQHGPFQEAEDLKQIYLLSDSLISKFAPYLDFE